MAIVAEFSAPGHNLQQDVPIRVWAPDNLPSDRPAPLALVYDGREYDDRAHLTEHISTLIMSGAVVPHRLALLEPGYPKYEDWYDAPPQYPYRNNWYGASPDYDDTVIESVIPELRERFTVEGKLGGIGASLGAISLAGLANANPGMFGWLRLQSTSFHHPDPRFDGGENGFYPEYDRVAKQVERIFHTLPVADTDRLDIGITWCSRIERNGNPIMADVLSEQGHYIQGGLVEGGHDYESWGRTLEPYLTNVMSRSWGYLREAA